VIGGGLTAIDTATESLAYYPVQVEKFLLRYEALVAERGQEAVCAEWNDAEREIAAEFITHGRAIRAERDAARREGRPLRLVELLNGWGGVTIAYRRRLVDSPSYTLNHEEVANSMQEGNRFAELRRERSWWRRGRSPIPCSGAKTRRTSSSTGGISVRSTRTATR